MLMILLVAGLATAALGSGDDDDSHGGGRRLGGLRAAMEPRLAVSAVRLQQMDEEIAGLKDHIENHPRLTGHDFVDELEARLDEVEGNGCAYRHFQCGGNQEQCLLDVLVCDGVEDCGNGHDESNDTCDDAPVHVGKTYSGTAHWTACSNRLDHPFHIQITGNRHDKDFGSRAWLMATIKVDLIVKGETEVHTYDAKGYYNYAGNYFALQPEDEVDHHEHEMGVKCKFNRGDLERAQCDIVMISTLMKCAEVHVTLEHEHDHDD